MTKRLLSLFTTILLVTATSLGQVAVTDVLGSYTGKLEVYFDFNLPTLIPVGNKENVKVFTSLQDNQKILLTLKDFSLQVGENTVEVGDITLPNVEIDNQGKVTAPVNVMQHPLLGELPVTLTDGIMTATAATLNIHVVWKETPESDPTNIVVKYINGIKDLNDGTGISSITGTQIKTVISENEILISGAELYNGSIYALTGALVSSAIAVNNTISIENISKGIYLVHLSTSEGVITRKIVRN